MLEKKILKTLAYYQALGNMPLTLSEIKTYLIAKEGNADVPLFDIQKSLEILIKYELVQTKNGFFYLKNASDNYIYTNRIENIKTTHKKWKKIIKISRFLIYIPYVRAFYVTGSISINNAKEKSDFDMLIKTRSNRIWLTRMSAAVVSEIFHRRRHNKKTKNRLCFNRFMETGGNWGPPNINYVINNRAVLWEQKNASVANEFIYSFKANFLGIIFKNIAEFILNITGLGLLAEKTVGYLEIQKIKHNKIEYPLHISTLKIKTSNIFFYYPSIINTEKKCKELLDLIQI